MRKSILYIALLAGLTSCRDSFDIDSLQNPSKLVVYCFPSEADTTWINVTNSIGVRKFTDSRKIRNLAEARVAYEVNGEARPVSQTEEGHFFVTGGHKPGDHVSISVEHDDYAPVTAETTIPQPVDVELKDVRVVSEYDPSWYEVRGFYQLSAVFTDPAETEDYYAVQVRMNGYQEYIDTYVDRWQEIVTIDEPLLQSTSDIDEDFGFEHNFYGQFYIFSDQEINGQTYTLHLDLPISGDASWLGSPKCRVVLYRISADYYRFLKAINDVENNELAKGGFAQLTPTHTNVRGGIGVLGGYWPSATPWWEIRNDNPDNNDNHYTDPEE